ncbi:MAG: polysaccharide deacetylase family protein [Patescibacteria group bacterium]
MEKDKYIIVNYHYVEDPNPKFSGIYPCEIKEFDWQISLLSSRYKIVSATEVCEAAKANRPGSFCAITFDDGLKDQYINALPILEKYGATAAFFPITSVYEGRLPVAHKTHILLSRMSASAMIDAIHGFMDEFYPDLAERYRIPKDRRLMERRPHEEPMTANMKETLIALPEDIKAQFLRFCFKQIHLDEAKIAQELFMSPKEILDLQKRGMTIGNHSHSHYAFDIINESVMKNELQISQEVLTGLIGKKPETFSYPHGRYGELAKTILAGEGFRYAFTIERRGVSLNDHPFLIPRFDATDVRKFL